jgi:hypothetical protein
VSTADAGTVYWFAMWRCGCTDLRAERYGPTACPEHGLELMAQPETADPKPGSPLGILTSDQTEALLAT